ncbi:MAG: M20 family metallopeptidase [Thermoplasmata archaeon]
MPQDLISEFSAFLERERSSILDDLRMLVESESPSTSEALLSKTADILKEMITRITGLSPGVEIKNGKQILSARYGNDPERNILILCHYDTVWPEGTISRLPFQIKGDICTGPGVFDMKSGILMSLYALKFLRTYPLKRSVTVLITPDEEVGSEASKALILCYAKKAEAVLVLESSERGMLKVGRKGVGTFMVQALGRASHAGLNPEAGINAISEISRLVLDVEKFADSSKGTTVNVGIIRGGTRTNVVPENAEIEIDVRVKTEQESKRIGTAFHDLKPHDNRIHLTVTGGIERPPMERNKRTDDLFRKVQQIGRKVGLELEACEVGGASDGNFVSAEGVPVIDGMGAVGEGAHALSEKIEISSTLNRILLVAATLLYI